MEQQDDPYHAVDDDDESFLNLEEGTLVEIRPRRNLFCRHRTVLLVRNDDGGDHHGRHHDQQQQQHQQQEKEEEHIDTIHLICIHGTAASHDQFLPLLEHLKNNINNNDENNRRQSNVNVHAWMYDAVGCGRSPDPASTATTDSSSSSSSSSSYSDEEQVLDLDAFLHRFVIRRKIGKEEKQQQQKLVSKTKKCQIFFIAHSYGPNWVYKWMKYNINRQQQVKEPKVLSSDHVVVEGLVLISTGLLDDDGDRNRKKLLVKGGPAIFKYCPLWILNCLQPTMTELFLKMGYSKNTHATKPQMISEARHVNNQNSMKTVCQYYNSHDWISQDELREFFNDFISSPTPTIPATNGTTGTRRRRNVKVLVVHGVEDQIIPIEKGQIVANVLSLPPTTLTPPATTPNEEEDYSNNGLIVVEDASHSIMQEQPEVLSKHILQLIGL